MAVDKGVPTFSKHVNLKANVIVQLDLELAYSQTAIQYFTH